MGTGASNGGPNLSADTFGGKWLLCWKSYDTAQINHSSVSIRPWSSESTGQAAFLRIISLPKTTQIRAHLKEREHRASSVPSFAAGPAAPLKRTTSCVSALGAAPAASAASRTGRCSDSATRSRTSSVIVALNSSVCLFRGVSRSTSLICAAYMHAQQVQP